MSGKKSGTSHRSEKSTAWCVIFGIVISFILAIILTLVGSAVVYSTPDPGSLTLPAALGILFVSAFAGGLASSLKGNGRMLPGLLLGGFYILLLLTLSVICPGGVSAQIGLWPSVGLHCALFPFAALGAFAASGLHGRGGRKRKRRR